MAIKMITRMFCLCGCHDWFIYCKPNKVGKTIYTLEYRTCIDCKKTQIKNILNEWQKI